VKKKKSAPPAPTPAKGGKSSVDRDKGKGKETPAPSTHHQPEDAGGLGKRKRDEVHEDGPGERLTTTAMNIDEGQHPEERKKKRRRRRKGPGGGKAEPARDSQAANSDSE